LFAVYTVHVTIPKN